MRILYIILIFVTKFIPDSNALETPMNCNCDDLETIRNLSRSQLSTKYPDLLQLYDLNYIKDHDLAYQSFEFIRLSNRTGNSANAECIGGKYSRFVIGRRTANGEQKGISARILLISAPYTGTDVEAKVEKDLYFDNLLEVMCYAKVDEGWISYAEWDKLRDPHSSMSPMFRLTNGNFGEHSERITSGGDYLLEDSPAHEYVTFSGMKVAPSLYNNDGDSQEMTYSRIFGNNFPTSGYASWETRPFSEQNLALVKMISGHWQLDADRYDEPMLRYIYPPERTAFKSSYNSTIPEEIVKEHINNNGNYVLDCMGNLYLIGQKIHATALGGAAVVSAGEISISNGKALYINNNSGHYQPSCSNLKNAIDYFNGNYKMKLPDPIPFNPENPDALCQSSILFNESSPRIRTEEIDENNVSFAIFPTPAQDRIMLSSGNPSSTNLLNISIHNTLGEIVLTKKIQKITTDTYYSIDVSNIQSGLYFIKLHDAPSYMIKFTIVR